MVSACPRVSSRAERLRNVENDACSSSQDQATRIRLWKCIRRKVLCRTYPRLKRAGYLDRFGKGVSRTRTRILEEREANRSGNESNGKYMLLTRRADPPVTLEGAQTYESPESRKALLKEELEKERRGKELVSFGFSASNACSGCIPLHHRSGSAIQKSPRVRRAMCSSNYRQGRRRIRIL